MADVGWSWCPECRKWVPERLMNYDYDPETRVLTRVCTPCIEGVSDQNDYVYDEHHEDAKCVFCGSYDTKELAPKWSYYTCHSCGKQFRRF